MRHKKNRSKTYAGKPNKQLVDEYYFTKYPEMSNSEIAIALSFRY